MFLPDTHNPNIRQYVLDLAVLISGRLRRPAADLLETASTLLAWVQQPVDGLDAQQAVELRLGALRRATRRSDCAEAEAEGLDAMLARATSLADWLSGAPTGARPAPPAASSAGGAP